MIFTAGNRRYRGNTADGFEATFSPDELSEFQINFLSLAQLCKTDPRSSQRDVNDRDGALSVRMYDAETGDFVYELSVYHHFKEGDQYDIEPPRPASGNDSCGVPLIDRVGAFGGLGNGAITDGASFSEWYRYVPGVNASKSHAITLIKNENGVYEHLTSEFYPIDGALYGNADSAHNEFFTYAITATFVHDACKDKFFEFEGNDDAWLYIDGEMVMDIGGVSTPSKQYVSMDRLDLQDGQEYTLSFYYAHRTSNLDSVFNMRTNIDLNTTAAPLPTHRAYD